MTQITFSVSNEKDTELLLSLAKKHNLEVVDIQRNTELTVVDFWNIIALLDLSKKAFKTDSTIQKVVEKLQTYSEENIQQFQEILAKKLFDLDKKIFAKNLAARYAWQPNKTFSSDYFLYARAYVVAQGKKFYEAVLADPTQMSTVGSFEKLLYSAEKAYEAKTGKVFDYIPIISYETFSNSNGWEQTLSDGFINTPESSKNNSFYDLTGS